MTPDPSLQGAVERARRLASRLDRPEFGAGWARYPSEATIADAEAIRTILAALPEPPGKSAESGEREPIEIERREIWRKVQLMAGDGLNSTGEGSPAWNALADIHSFAVKQQLGERTEPMNFAAAPKPPEKPRG